MKFSIALTALILVVGLLPGLLYQKKIAGAHEHRSELRAEAGKLGIDLTNFSDDADLRTTKRRRAGQTRRATDVSGEFLRFAGEMEGRSGYPQFDPDLSRRANDMIGKLLRLSPAELRRVLEDLRDASDVSRETRRNLIGYTILTMSPQDPERAAKMAVETAGLLGDSVVGEQALLSSLSHWAKQDPAAAVAWFGQVAKSNPDLDDNDLKCSLVSGIAYRDPVEAFRMLGDIGFEDDEDGVAAIMQTASESPERRDAVLAALRTHLAGVTSPAEREGIREEAFSELANSLDADDFDASVRWLEGADLSEEELAAFATGLGYFDIEDSAGRWIEWLSANLQMDDLEEPVQEMMGEWTQQDYLAAGRWLAAAPESDGKRAAVAAYAEAVAEYEPQVAVQWAMTLPDTWRREVVLRTIHENWPEDDPQGAATFADQYGIK